MAEASKIQWTDATWNPVRGCTKVSPGCKHCYAEAFAERFRGVKGHPYEQGFDLRLVPGKLEEPRRWKAPRRIFVNSMSDLFHEGVPFDFIDEVFAVMALCPQHTFQVLTKRPLRMLEYLRLRTGSGGGPTDNIGHEIEGLVLKRTGRFDVAEHPWPLPNVWLGVSVEDQRYAGERIPLLMRCPAAVRFLSCEPLLGPITLPLCFHSSDDPNQTDHAECAPIPDWVIVGGESGPGARGCDLRWIRSLVGQCRASGVPVFVKQLGASADLKDKKGGDMEEWPEDLRVREWPRGVKS